MPQSHLRPSIILFGLYIGFLFSNIDKMCAFLIFQTTLLSALSVSVSMVDFEKLRIPNSLNVTIFLVGFLTILTMSGDLVISHIAAALFCLVLLWSIGEFLFWAIRLETLGIGDAKLFGAGVMWIGPFGAPSALLIASIGGILYATLRFLLKKSDRQQFVPFGPFLAFGIYVTWILGPITF